MILLTNKEKLVVLPHCYLMAVADTVVVGQTMVQVLLGEIKHLHRQANELAQDNDVEYCDWVEAKHVSCREAFSSIDTCMHRCSK